MPTRAHPLPVRFSRWLLACAVRHWPEETRSWGLALAAEIDETGSTFETLLWSWGGIMLFTRSVFSTVLQWLNLPAGASVSGKASGGPLNPASFPKRSRLFTAGVVIAAVVVLSLPMSWEAIATVRASWDSNFVQTGSDRRALEKLAARAEKENDPATLAFVALCVDDSDRYVTLADRTVALNPDFVWIYGARTYWPAGSPVGGERLARLQAADPGNAEPAILAADAIAQRDLGADGSRLRGKDLEARLAGDPQWMALMERAFAAPRYDSYMLRHWELTGSVWRREKYLSPPLVLRSLWTHAIPNLLNMRTFSNIRIHEAEKAFAAGNMKEAERLLGEVDAFGQRMADAKSTRIEELIAFAISKDVNLKLGELYTRAGRTTDAQRAASRVQQIDDQVAAIPKRHSASLARERAFRWWGILVQGSCGLILIAGFIALMAILVLELLPIASENRRTLWRRALCWAADYAPATLLVASAALLLSFLPYARAFSDFFSSNNAFANEDFIVDALLGFVAVPQFVSGPSGNITIWLLATGVLAMLAVFVVAHGIYRGRRAQHI